MKKIRVNWDFLCLAFEDASCEREYHLDTKTGEVIMIADSMATEECEQIREELEEDTEDRYLYVEKQTSHEGYQDMEDFIETVEDENLKDKLYIAIDGRGAFRRFKDVLYDHPEERERWLAFRDTHLEERIIAWLEVEGYQTERPTSSKS